MDKPQQQLLFCDTKAAFRLWLGMTEGRQEGESTCLPRSLGSVQDLPQGQPAWRWG